MEGCYVSYVLRRRILKMNDGYFFMIVSLVMMIGALWVIGKEEDR
jgi:hypothetical protein